MRATMLPTICLALASAPAHAAEPPRAAIEASVRAADAAFWAAYNSCDAGAMAARFTEDAEFYHDATGLSTTRAGVTASMMRGPCVDPAAKRLRRELIGARFDPLAGGYALLAGEHRFFVTMNGGGERHDTIARFAEVWQQVGGARQMRRTVSYDHRPDLPRFAAVALTRADLKMLPGRYVGADGTTIDVVATNGALSLASGPSRFALAPLGNGRFGVADRWLQFRFAGGVVHVEDEGREVARATRRP